MTVLLALVYVLFFLSGAAALVYQLVWVRWLTLVFGASHLAVTTVLTIFMAGLAIGGYVFGRRADRLARPLRTYAVLELGIAASAVLSGGLMQLYPAIYVALAHGRDDARVYLTVVRVVFSAVALVVPTILMGATLPVLSRFVSRQSETLRSRLSFLYGFNTLGAVTGAALSGFVLLRLYGVGTTMIIAIATNLVVGAISLLLDSRWGVPGDEPSATVPTAPVDRDVAASRLVLFGIGLSGFCALGYEVLWTRVLTLGVGASVYGFTIMLVAFLAGIALGSEAYGALVKVLHRPAPTPRGAVVRFGATQVLIGLSALLVTIYLRDIPVTAVRLQQYVAGAERLSFEGRVWAGFALAFLYMLVPAMLMGAAFPMAAAAVARHGKPVGRAVGDVLASNTVGAILGAATSGLLLIRLVGIERTLQMLTLVNIGAGLLLLASVLRRRWLMAATAIVTTTALGVLAVNQSAVRLWDHKYFAIFRSNQPEAFRTAAMVREAVDNTDVLYYAEGVESSVSVIQVRGGEKAFVTNGRVEASSSPQAQQVQYTLGHLPLLLNANPKDVLVVGLGSGMTAGAASIHPTVERVTLVELEPQVLGVARAFEEYNHHVLDSPKLQVVFNDGRNFLMTTDRQFDVITADPIHPWFRGAGSLYAAEYFRLAAAHLKPGGVIAQWLPIYELTPADLASVVRTFRQQFPHTMMWLNHYDAVIVGSLSPLTIDERQIECRMAYPAVAADLRKVMMAPASAFLSYFVMGSDGMQRFAEKGAVNTDDRPYLEFSAPFSIASPGAMAANVGAIAIHRESLLPYLTPAAEGAARLEQQERWALQLTAGHIGDTALALFLGGNAGDPRFVQSLHRLAMDYPGYAPGAFLAAEYGRGIALEPKLLQQSSFSLTNADGSVASYDLSAVLVPVSGTRAAVMFVDNRAHVIYGQAYLDGDAGDGRADRFAQDVMDAVAAAYAGELRAAITRKQTAPAALATLDRFKAVIAAKVQRVQ